VGLRIEHHDARKGPEPPGEPVGEPTATDPEAADVGIDPPRGEVETPDVRVHEDPVAQPARGPVGHAGRDGRPDHPGCPRSTLLPPVRCLTSRPPVRRHATRDSCRPGLLLPPRRPRYVPGPTRDQTFPGA